MFFVSMVKSVAASCAGPDRYECDRRFPTPGRRILEAAATNFRSASERLPPSQQFALSHCLQITHVPVKIHRINIRNIFVVIIQHSISENTFRNKPTLNKIIFFLFSSNPPDKWEPESVVGIGTGYGLDD
jgi:hypothetical protein